MKKFVKDIEMLNIWQRLMIKPKKITWMVDPYSGNVYAMVVHREELYIVGESGSNRARGNA